MAWVIGKTLVISSTFCCTTTRRFPISKISWNSKLRVYYTTLHVKTKTIQATCKLGRLCDSYLQITKPKDWYLVFSTPRAKTSWKKWLEKMCYYLLISIPKNGSNGIVHVVFKYLLMCLFFLTTSLMLANAYR